MRYFNTVLNQLLGMIDREKFESRARQGGANRYTKHYTAWNQFIVNLYAQACQKKSLRDIEMGFKLHQGCWYHLGLVNVTRSTISYANQKRDSRFYEQTFYELLEKCRSHTPKHKFKFKNPLYALDATVIDLCLSVFPWAKFRKAKGALKIHSLLDYRGNLPSFLVVTDALQHEITVAKEVSWPLCSDSILVMDKAYLDFQWLYGLHLQKVSFVLRAKANLDCQVLGQHTPSTNKAVLSDQIVRLAGPYSSQKYPEILRLVTFYDEQEKRIFRFLTNNLTLSPVTIAAIYKARWDIELFFKWIKQHLKIKTFLGTSRNAVLTQIWTAMTYYLLLAYIKYQTRYGYSLLHFTRVIRESLFTRKDIIDLLNLSLYKLKKLPDTDSQLFLFG